MAHRRGKILNVGVIGAGAFMSRQHLPNIARDPRYRIHTLCRRQKHLLEDLARQYKPVRCTDNADEVLMDTEIDVVFVGTRAQMHAHFLKKAVEYGKHVYVEKPMTMTYKATREVLKSFKDSDVTVGVGFNRRFAPSLLEARKLFNSCRKGPSNIIYRIVDDHEIRPEYIFDMKDGGGHLLQEGCHIFDLLAWFLDAEPVEVYAAGPLETDNFVTFKFSDDSIAVVVCGGKGGIFYPKECMEVFCNRTTLVLDHFFELRLDGPCRSLIKRFPLDPKSKTRPRNYSMTGFYEAQFALRPKNDIVGAHAANKYFTFSVDKGHTQAIIKFAECVATGRKYAPGVIDGARATVMALKAYDSIRKNKPVKISPEEYGLR